MQITVRSTGGKPSLWPDRNTVNVPIQNLDLMIESVAKKTGWKIMRVFINGIRVDNHDCIPSENDTMLMLDW